MTATIALRPARPDDAPLAAAVFRLSMDATADHLFGNGRRAEFAFMRLFSRNAGRFGYGVASVAELNKQPAGMLVSFPGAALNRLTLTVAKYLPRALGWNIFGFAARSLSFANIKETDTDEYFVSNLAVLPAAQGCGLGTQLLLHAEAQARSNGLKKCALMVSPSNETALRLYKCQGYEIIFTKHDKKHLANYHRMVKVLAPLP